MSRIIRKSIEIDILLYSHQNDVTVKEQLVQLYDIFKLIEVINQEMIELSSRSSSYKSSRLSTKERSIEEKVRLVGLQAEATFMQKKRYAELQIETLQIEEEMAKVQARVKIYEGENIDQKVPLKTLTMGDIKPSDSRYPVTTKKQSIWIKMRNQAQLHNSRLGQGSTDFPQPTISKGSYRISNIICKTNRVVLHQIKMKPQTGSQNLVRIMTLGSSCTNWSRSN